MSSVIFFNAPENQLKRLERIYVDRLAHRDSWKRALEKLHSEWQEFILYGTVLLTANVAYLAIQSVDNDKDSPYRSPAQITSYVSVYSSLGSMIMGLLLLRKNRIKDRERLTAAVALLSSWDDDASGLEFLAITYCLPYALFLWGMISFLAAFTLTCFLHANEYARIAVGMAHAILGILFAWYVRVTWKSDRGEKDEKDEKVDLPAWRAVATWFKQPWAQSGDGEDGAARPRWLQWLNKNTDSSKTRVDV